MTIEFFSILGERCSGTNFVQQAIKRNFKLKYSWKYGHKHFFGLSKYEESDDHLFIGVVRNPYEWVESFYRNHPEIKGKMLKNKDMFINSQVMSRGYYHKEDLLKLGIQTNENIISKYPNGKMVHFHEINFENLKLYDNIFQMRNNKMKYLLNEMPDKVKNFIIIRYEDLLDNYDKILLDLQRQFKLERINKKAFKTVLTYKGKKNAKVFNKEEVKRRPKTFKKSEIKLHLNETIEKKLGYDI